MDDLAESLSGDSMVEKQRIRATIITSFKATMADQCAVNPVFNSFIEKLRTELLPSVVNFNAMSEQDKSNILEMGHFVCRLKNPIFSPKVGPKIVPYWAVYSYTFSYKIMAWSETPKLRLLSLGWSD